MTDPTPTPDPVYLQLHDHIGLESSHIRTPDGLEIPNERAGEPAPLNNVGFQIPVPVMIGDEVGTTTRRITVLPADRIPEPDMDKPETLLGARIIPGTRTVETTNPAVINALLSTGDYHQVDPPKGAHPNVARDQAKAAADARAAAEKLAAEKQAAEAANNNTED